MTPEEVGELMSVSPQTVKNWLRAGTLKGFKLGDLWRIKGTDLMEMVDRNTTYWVDHDSYIDMDKSFNGSMALYSIKQYLLKGSKVKIRDIEGNVAELSLVDNDIKMVPCK